MKLFYSARTRILLLFLLPAMAVTAQTPTLTVAGNCSGVVANFNTTDNGFNSPSIYGSVFDSSFYFHAGRGYWTDYLPPTRIGPPGAPRVLNIISPPYNNPNPTGTFNIGFYYIVPNASVDRFQVRIVSVTQTPMGTVTNVEATSGVQFFSTWSTPSAYVDGVTTSVPDPTPFMGLQQGNVCIRLIDPDINNGPNTTFRVEVSYLITTPLFAVFDNLSIGPLNSPLPVNFIGLLANKNPDNSVLLKWDVSEEVDVNRYEVERSSNGSSFSLAGSVNAKGKSIYSFTDPTISTGTVYYRVKSIDMNGSFKYSGVVRLKGSAGNSYGDGLVVYPTPATDQVTFEHARITRDAKIVITAMDGRIVKIVVPVEGASHTPVDVSAFRPGMYMVRFDDGGGFIQTAKLIKK